MTTSTQNVQPYKIPSPKIRHNRKLFYGLYRKFEEPIEKWLKRVEIRINRCDFAKLTEYFLIDKFVGELNDVEFDVMQSTRRTWSLKQLREYILDERNDDTDSVTDAENTTIMIDETDNHNGDISVVEITKSKTVCLSLKTIVI